MGSPSEYAKNPKEAKEILRNKGRSIYDHRDGDHRDGDNGDEITLHYQGFQQFLKQCDTVVLDEADYKFRNSMCNKMSQHFSKEKERQNEFIELMKEYMPANSAMKSKGFKKRPKYDGCIDPCSCVILEVKNESGQGGGSDSYAQVIAYYVKSLKEKPVDRCPAPAFLLELVGPHLFISGAVYGKYVFVDRLVDPVWLVPHQREEAMIRIARIFKALKKEIGEIQGYYKNKLSEEDEGTQSEKSNDTSSEEDEGTQSEKSDDTSSEEDEGTQSEKSNDTSSEEDEGTQSEKSDNTSSEEGNDKSSKDISLHRNGFPCGKTSSESICGKVQGTTSKECNQDSAKSVKSWLKTILTNTLFLHCLEQKCMECGSKTVKDKVALALKKKVVEKNAAQEMLDPIQVCHVA